MRTSTRPRVAWWVLFARGDGHCRCASGSVVGPERVGVGHLRRGDGRTGHVRRLVAPTPDMKRATR